MKNVWDTPTMTLPVALASWKVGVGRSPEARLSRVLGVDCSLAAIDLEACDSNFRLPDVTNLSIVNADDISSAVKLMMASGYHISTAKD